MLLYLCLSIRLEALGEFPHVHLKRTLVPQELHVSTVDTNLALLAPLHILLTTERCEAPVLGDDDLLATRKLVLAAA